MLLTFIASITFCEDVRFSFWTLFDTQLMNFIRKYVLLLILDFQYENFKSLFAVLSLLRRGSPRYESFFEVTTSRSRAIDSWFHNVAFGLGVSQFPAQCFGNLPDVNI